MNLRRWLACAIFAMLGDALAAPPLPPTDPKNLAAPALEAVVQELRPFDDHFVHHPPLELTLDESVDLYHRLWQLGRRGVRAAGADRELAAEFRTIEERARVAVHAGLQARRGFRVNRRDALPVLTPEDERRTVQMVATVVARGEDVMRAISRVLARFPLWTDDAVWGYRPPRSVP